MSKHVVVCFVYGDGSSCDPPHGSDVTMARKVWDGESATGNAASPDPADDDDVFRAAAERLMLRPGHTLACLFHGIGSHCEPRHDDDERTIVSRVSDDPSSG